MDQNRLFRGYCLYRYLLFGGVCIWFWCFLDDVPQFTAIIVREQKQSYTIHSCNNSSDNFITAIFFLSCCHKSFLSKMYFSFYYRARLSGLRFPACGIGITAWKHSTGAEL